VPSVLTFCSAFGALQVQPDVLSVDHYPFFELADAVEGDNATKAGYRANLATLQVDDSKPWHY
jgi:hypothetical protein